MAEDANRTVHAQQAFEFSEVFGYKFDPVLYGKARPRRLKLQQPDGPSTAGGKLARQSLVLVPDDDGSNLVVGFIDATQKTAELRSFKTVSQQFSARFKAKIDMTQQEYEDLLADLRSFLKIQKIDHKIIEASAGPRPKPAAQAQPQAGQAKPRGDDGHARDWDRHRLRSRVHRLRRSGAMSFETRDTSKYHDGHDDGFEPVEALDLSKVTSFADLLRGYQKASFGARRIGDAFEVMKAMAEDQDCYVVMTLSGAMTVAKMGLVVCEMIERGYVDLIVSTGALQAHGMIEGSGMQHFKYRAEMDDAELFEKGYDRVYDTLELEKNLDALELIVREVLNDIPDGAVVGSVDIFDRLGAHLVERFPDGRGIVKSAHEHHVPIIVPAFTDSEMGLDVSVNNEIRADEGRGQFSFDPFRDLRFYRDAVVDRERLGIFTIGGGVPRNWAQQIGPYLEISQSRRGIEGGKTQRFSYGVRICPDSEHWGGLSGCTYSEGTSWGKFVPEAEGGRYAEVLADATMVWPLLVKALMETVPYKNRSRESPRSSSKKRIAQKP